MQPKSQNGKEKKVFTLRQVRVILQKLCFTKTIRIKKTVRKEKIIKTANEFIINI